MAPWMVALIAHGLLGGLDIVLNHEWLARLPAQPAARREQGLHSLRELLFAALFAMLAWYQWQGAWALLIAGLFAAQIAIDLADTVLELDTRRLPVPERILHVLLFINLGVVMALLGPTVADWYARPAAVVPAGYGAPGWVLGAQAALALGWSMRDALSWRRLPRIA